MARTAGSVGKIMSIRTRANLEFPPMPACWDNQQDWEGWCSLMAITYRQEYNMADTLDQALCNYCIDCEPGIVRDMMIESGRCRKYSVRGAGYNS